MLFPSAESRLPQVMHDLHAMHAFMDHQRQHMMRAFSHHHHHFFFNDDDGSGDDFLFGRRTIVQRPSSIRAAEDPFVTMTRNMFEMVDRAFVGGGRGFQIVASEDHHRNNNHDDVSSNQNRPRHQERFVVGAPSAFLLADDGAGRHRHNHHHHHHRHHALGGTSSFVDDERYDRHLLEQAIQASMEVNDPGAPPLPQNFESKLKKVTPKTRAELKKFSSCSICMEEPRMFVEVCVLPCAHDFCKECILGWLKKHGTCPVCRSDVTEHMTTKNKNPSSSNNSNNNIRSSASERMLAPPPQRPPQRPSAFVARGDGGGSGAAMTNHNTNSHAAPSHSRQQQQQQTRLSRPSLTRTTVVGGVAQSSTNIPRPGLRSMSSVVPSRRR